MAMEYFEERVAPNLKQRLLSSRPLNCPVMSPSIAKSEFSLFGFFLIWFFFSLDFFLYWIIHYQSSILPVVRQVQPLAVATPSTSRTEKDDESKIRKDMKAIQASSKREVQELRAKVGMFFFFHFFKISLFVSFIQLLEMEKRQKEQNQAMFEMQTRIADQEMRIQELTSKPKESVVSLPGEGEAQSSSVSEAQSSSVRVSVSEAQSPSVCVRVRVGPQRSRTKVSRSSKVMHEGPCTRTRSKRTIEANRDPQIKRTRK